MAAGTTKPAHQQLHARRRGSPAAQPAESRPATVVAVDRDASVLDQLTTGAAGQTIVLEICQDPIEALLLIGRLSPDAVILGPITEPIQDSDILMAVRRLDPDVPVVVGVDADDPERAAQANACGATAIVPRPYRVPQLLGLLLSLSRGGTTVELAPPVLDFGALRIDSTIPQVWLRGQHVELPLREFQLLRYLAERAGTVVGREELETALWGSHGTPSSNSLTVHVMRLRRRLGDDESSQGWIRVTRGFGYRFQLPDAEAGPTDGP